MIFVNLPCNKIFSESFIRRGEPENICSFYIANDSEMRKTPCQSCDFWAQFSINTKKWHHRTWVLERWLEIHFTCEYWQIRHRSCDFLSSTNIFSQICMCLRIHKKCRTDLYIHIELFSFLYHLSGQKSHNTTQVLSLLKTDFFDRTGHFSA